MAKKATLSLAQEFPELLQEWDYEKNTSCPSMVTRGSSEKVWWKCELGHKWKTAIGDRTRSKGCPYCSNRLLWVGFNDMWTTNPELASLLANPEDGYKYMQNSGKYVDWKCGRCKNTTYNKMIRNINKNGISCCYCSPTVSIGERIMSNLLKELDIDFEYQRSFEWIKNRRYDFYLPQYNTIIETHGGQHYCNRMFKDVEVQKEIDKMKECVAKENSIEGYVIIDCTSGEIEKIKKEIEYSSMNYLLRSQINWHTIAKNSATDEMKNIWDMWNEGLDTKEISETAQISSSSVRIYLRHGYMARECSYTPHRGNHNSHGKRAVVQLDLKGKFIKEYTSLKNAAQGVGAKSHSMILGVCKGNKQTSAGFRWMYKEDYERRISDDSETVISDFIPSRKPIIQLNLDGEFIKERDSAIEASHYFGLKSPNSIRLASKDLWRVSCGFKWMYKEDYNRRSQK